MVRRAREKTGGHWVRLGSPQPRAASSLGPRLPLPSRPVFRREALGVVLHKDSKWYQQWKDFRDNNVVFSRECPAPGDSRAAIRQ